MKPTEQLPWGKRLIGHLKTINHHKWLVCQMCFQVGLYRQGLLHDMSKYSLPELLPSVRYWQGTRSPYAREKEVKGYSLGWLHHKGRNKHHFEYWMDYVHPGEGLIGTKMPKRYVIEMFIDRVSACKNYRKDDYRANSALEYYEKGKAEYIMHPDSRFLLEYLLHMLAEKGEPFTLQFIKKTLLAEPDGDYSQKDGHLLLK
jgi:hypothetical protein